MARPTWRGSLKLSLVAIPIRVFPASDPGADVSFRQLHRRCHTPIQMKRWCPHCEEEVAAEDIVKGYETAKGQYVLVEEEEIAKARPESTHAVEITHTVPAAAVDPVLIERAYYLVPDSKAAGSAFAVVRDALGAKAAVGYLRLHGREYLVAVLPRDPVLVLYTLRTTAERRDVGALDGVEFAAAKARPEELKLARQVLASFATAPDLSQFTDHYQDALRAMIASRRDERTVVVEGQGPSAAPKGQVVSLVDALRRSLESAAGGRKPAVHAHRTPGRVLAHPSGRRTRRAG